MIAILVKTVAAANVAVAEVPFCFALLLLLLMMLAIQEFKPLILVLDTDDLDTS